MFLKVLHYGGWLLHITPFSHYSSRFSFYGATVFLLFAFGFYSIVKSTVYIKFSDTFVIGSRELPNPLLAFQTVFSLYVKENEGYIYICIQHEAVDSPNLVAIS